MEKEEAMKILKDFHDKSALFSVRTALDTVFPELAESEDEKIRKAIIATIHLYYGEPLEDEAKDMIAWLEKQGGKPQGKTALEAAKEEKVDNQNCVKPVDKAEPKFHEGDYGYQVNYKGKLLHRDTDIIEKEYHLWTIKDAKDGDILVNGSNIFIFSHLSDTRAMGYCHINLDDGRFYDDKDKTECFGLIDAVFSPATKEQRDLLFQKMKEAGYTFDFDKKELRKIEQNLANSAKPCKDDTLLYLLNKMPSCITVDGIDYHFVMKKTSIYLAYYACYNAIGEEGRGNAIFGITAHSPIDLLAEMLEHLKKKGLLE